MTTYYHRIGDCLDRLMSTDDGRQWYKRVKGKWEPIRYELISKDRANYIESVIEHLD